MQTDPIPARAETNSTGSPPLVCSATGHSETLSSSRPFGSYRMVARIEIAEHRHFYKSRVTSQCKSALS